MEKNSKSGLKYISIIMAVMLIFQVGLITYNFVFNKESYHSDEIWNYGMANSNYRPHLFAYGLPGNNSTDFYTNDKRVPQEYNDGSIFSDYITVQKGEQFDFGSVYYNLANDLHPPMYFFLLHAVCSFFPDIFSPWIAFVINIAVMVIGQIFLYKASSRMLRSPAMGLVVCFLWGFSMGCMNVNNFLRMYSAVSMFSIIYLYYNVRVFNDEGSLKRNVITLMIITFMGTLTDYGFLYAAFPIAACMCFYLLFSKKIKKMLAYAFSVLGGVVISYLFFPYLFGQVFSSSTVESWQINRMPFVNGFRFCISLITSSLIGVPVSIWASGIYNYVVAVIVILAAIVIPLCFLFRKETWFKKFVSAAGEKVKYFLKNFDFLFLFTFLSVIFAMLVVDYTVNFHNMENHSDRYLFVIMPWAAIIFVSVLWYILRAVKLKQKLIPAITAVILAPFLIYSHLSQECRYNFPTMTVGGGISSTTSSNSSHIIVLHEYWRAVCYSDKLMGCDEAAFVQIADYDKYYEQLSAYKKGNDCYVSIETAISNLMKNAIDKYEDDSNDSGAADQDSSGIVNFSDDDLFEDYDTISEENIVQRFEENIFPGYRLQLCTGEMMMGEEVHTYKVVPADEYVEVTLEDLEAN